MPDPKDKAEKKPSQQQSLPLTWDADESQTAPQDQKSQKRPAKMAGADEQPDAHVPAEDESLPPWNTDDEEAEEAPGTQDRDETDDETDDQADEDNGQRDDAEGTSETAGDEGHHPDEPETEDEPADADAEDEPEAAPARTMESGEEPEDTEYGDLEAVGGDGAGSTGSPDVVQLKNAVESIGQRLMRARAEKGLTVGEVAGRTQIRPSVVEDLESDRYDRLPVEYYCIRHIEALCREYGIAADPIVEQFKREFSTQDGGAPHAERFSVTSLESESGSKVTYTPTSATVAGAGKRSISITGIIVSVLILLLAVLAVGAWAVQQWRSRAPAGEDELSTPQEARDLTQFIVPQQLPLDSMPIPKD